MPFQSPKRKISDAENKLRVLFCVDALSMTTLEQLWPFVAQLELMEYMPFCLYMDELKKDGAVATGSHAAQGMLYLTEAGRQTLLLFSGKLLAADRARILASAPSYFAKLTERRRVRAVHERAQEGTYRVACTVREGDVPTLFLRVVTQKQPLANCAMKRFGLNAPQILMLLYTWPDTMANAAVPNAMAEDGSTAVPMAEPPRSVELAGSLEQALQMAAPERPMLCAYGKHEHSAVVCLEGVGGDAGTSFAVALLMPNYEAAVDWVQTVLVHKAELCARLCAALQMNGEGPEK